MAGDGNKSPRDIPRAQMQQQRAKGGRKARGKKNYTATFAWNTRAKEHDVTWRKEDRCRDDRGSGGDFHVGRG